MDLHYKQQTIVGALVLVAIGIFLVGTVWLSGRSLAAGRVIHANFTNIGNLKRGSPVRVSGVEIGKVENIEFRAVEDVVVRLSYSDRVEPMSDAKARVVSIGLVGDVALDLDPGTSSVPLARGTEIEGTVDGGLGALGADLGSQASTVLKDLHDLLSSGLADDLRRSLNATERVMNTFGNTNRGPTAELTGAMASLRRLGERLDSTLATPGLRQALTNLDTVTANMAHMTAQLTTTGARLDSLLDAINRGEGTLGKFATDTTLYTGMVDVSQSLKQLLDGLNQEPGKLTVQLRLF
ncbi:MAG: MCE family protein [Gemmatimonadales bacterium]|nr:MCE family protein [Gemmatimonadales bacterium]